MKKQRNIRHLDVSLLPFLNIMLCTLGVLVLISGVIVGFSLQVSGITTTDVSLIAETSGSDRQPQYFVWDGAKITTLPQGITTPLAVGALSNPSNSELKTLVSRLGNLVQGTVFGSAMTCVNRNADKRYAVFLIKPSGFSNFLLMREYILSTGATIGYEAIGQHWEIETKGTPCR